MAEITEKNTKAEILNAYHKSYGEVINLKEQIEELKIVSANNNETILRLESEAELAAKIEKEPAPGMNESELLKVESILEELTRLKEKQISVVIPYVAEFGQGNELQLALRGWGMHFKENFNVVIIGDREPWMNEQVDVIECKRLGNNPPIDIANKMLLAIESELVTEKFIWANDDQYLVSPCLLSDFEILKCEGNLKPPFPNNLYGKNKQFTLEILQKEKKSTWDYSTHTPFIFEKEKLKALIVKFKLTHNARLISSLYFNWYFPEFVPLRMKLETDNLKVGVYRQNANFGKLKQLIPQKNW